MDCEEGQQRLCHLEQVVRQLTETVQSYESLKVEPRSLATAFDSGDTAWVLASTALVLFMTIPGLALYYGGIPTE